MHICCLIVCSILWLAEYAIKDFHAKLSIRNAWESNFITKWFEIQCFNQHLNVIADRELAKWHGFFKVHNYSRLVVTKTITQAKFSYHIKFINHKNEAMLSLLFQAFNFSRPLIYNICKVLSVLFNLILSFHIYILRV